MTRRIPYHCWHRALVASTLLAVAAMVPAWAHAVAEMGDGAVLQSEAVISPEAQAVLDRAGNAQRHEALCGHRGRDSRGIAVRLQAAEQRVRAQQMQGDNVVYVVVTP
jgi:hypothetical protein